MKKMFYPETSLVKKMHAQGWDTVEDFYTNSSVKEVASRETCRLLILHNKRIVEPIFIKIAEAMGFTPNEIKKLLLEYGYTDFAHLIGDHQGRELTSEQEAVLSIYEKLINKNPRSKTMFINFLESICQLTESGCTEDLKTLKQYLS
jgi:hypothetical protein